MGTQPSGPTAPLSLISDGSAQTRGNTHTKEHFCMADNHTLSSKIPVPFDHFSLLVVVSLLDGRQLTFSTASFFTIPRVFRRQRQSSLLQQTAP
jgi:hypothetical protein